MPIPDVLNTLLMGLILLVIVVTVVRPILLHLVSTPGSDKQLHRLIEQSVEEHLTLEFEKAAAERAAQVHFQRLLLEAPSPSLHLTHGDAHPASRYGAAPSGAVVADVDSEGGAASRADNTEDEVEIQEGESLADIKQRLKREQQQAKKPVIPPELLQGANSYEDKVGVVRMVGQNDRARVASLIRNMVQTELR